mmetsp:Transcript_18514/g.36238  ORF Transcript_18514/g.36238 Transcript_18514/m.36238 type:complete len:237 (-) Transcript_18514:489-1199(-)
MNLPRLSCSRRHVRATSATDTKALFKAASTVDVLGRGDKDSSNSFKAREHCCSVLCSCCWMGKEHIKLFPSSIKAFSSRREGRRPSSACAISLSELEQEEEKGEDGGSGRGLASNRARRAAARACQCSAAAIRLAKTVISGQVTARAVSTNKCSLNKAVPSSLSAFAAGGKHKGNGKGTEKKDAGDEGEVEKLEEGKGGKGGKGAAVPFGVRLMYLRQIDLHMCNLVCSANRAASS